MRDRALVASVVGGLLGGLVGAAVMSAAHISISRARPPAPPPADRREDDATVKVADALWRAARHAPLPDRAKPLAGSLVHYAFGATTGLVHGLAARVTHLATAGGGLGFGAAVWLGAHVVTVPALGLAPSPRRQPLDQEGIELVLHLLFGVCAEQVRRLAVRLAG
jgi:putative membrane protein